ncbi:MAG TPA: molybdate ABC transporter substrate-binding protein [Victivallales bacterium]|nr:molybdate ABC transporter substrate-binding protein [Victivallales bacterium]
MKLFKYILVGVTLLLSTNIFAGSVLYWYLAASMAKPGTEIVQNFNKENHSFQVILMLGGSGQLLSKIQASHKGDIYTPASGFFLKKAEKLNLVKNSKKLLTQYPVFGLSKKLNNKKLTFNDIVNGKYKLAVGNPNTMALGQTYINMKKKMGPDIAAKLKKNEAVYALNVGQDINYVMTGVVDAGLMYNTDATANNIKYVTIPSKYNIPAAAYLATLKTATSDNNVKIFENYIYKNSQIFKKYGFDLVTK